MITINLPVFFNLVGVEVIRPVHYSGNYILIISFFEECNVSVGPLF